MKFKGKAFIDKISIPEYNELPCLRSTDLKNFLHSPAKYKWEQMHRDEEGDNKAFIIGNYVHAALLEPETLARDFVVLDMKTRHSKEFYSTAANAKKTGKTVILSGEVAEINYMVENVQGDPHVMELLNESYPEISTAAKIGDVWLKARLDAYIPERRIVMDIKTTGETIFWFSNNVKRWGYEVSAPLYMDVLNTAALELNDPNHGADTYLFLVIEKAAPYGVKLFEMTSEYMAVGRTKYMKALPLFKRCLETNVWNGYDNRIPEKLYPSRGGEGDLTPNEKVN